MKRNFGGDKIFPGLYLNLKSGEFLDLKQAKAVLPGTYPNSFIRVPGWLPFIAGPAFGLLSVIFLPLAGIVALANVALIKTRLVQVLLPQGGIRHPGMIK